MRKLKFPLNGEIVEGYYFGLNGDNILVEDMGGNVHSVDYRNVTFIDKPVCMAPVKVIDLGLMKNALESLKDSNNPYTITDLLKVAEEKNIIIIQKQIDE